MPPRCSCSYSYTSRRTFAVFALLHLISSIAASHIPTNIRRSPQLTPAANVDVHGNWAGWPTTTVIRTRTVTAGESDQAQAITTTSTIVESTPAQTTGTQTVYTTTAVLAGQAGTTQTTTTFTSTSTQSQSTRTVTTTTSRLPDATPQPDYDPNDPQKFIPRFARCEPGNDKYEEPGVLSVTREQKITLIAIPIMWALILIGWNFVIIRYIIYPLKMLVLILHEAGHVTVGILMGRDLSTVATDPADGGLCIWKNPIETDDGPGPYPVIAIPFGYTFSILLGCTLILCGFNTLYSKVASILIGILFLVVAVNLLGTPLGLVLVAANLGLLIALWFIDHARFLRFLVLFVGIMSTWYVLWDFIDDWVFGKLNPCCCVLHAERFGFLHAWIWLWIWLLITSVFFAATIIVGVYAFRQSPHSMFCQGQAFLAT